MPEGKGLTLQKMVVKNGQFFQKISDEVQKAIAGLSRQLSQSRAQHKLKVKTPERLKAQKASGLF